VAEITPGRTDLEPLLQLMTGQGAGTSRPFDWTMAV
jgi:hypothetical protein